MCGIADEVRRSVRQGEARDVHIGDAPCMAEKGESEDSVRAVIGIRSCDADGRNFTFHRVVTS